MRKVDTLALAAVNAKIALEGFFGTYTWVPVADGQYFRRSVVKSLQEGKTNGVRSNLLYSSTHYAHTFWSSVRLPIRQLW